MASATTLLQGTPGAVGLVTLENAGTAILSGGFTSFGQTFAQGELRSGASLTAQIGGSTVPVQVDVKTTWPDGSAKMVVLTLERPALAAGSETPVVLVASTDRSGPDPAPVSMTDGLAGHSFLVTLTPLGKDPVQIDVLQALKTALADGTASFWQKGPLASQARVEIDPPGSSQRLVFDVTVFKDGTYSVDAQFNNDNAMEAVGGRIQYGVNVAMDGKVVATEQLNQAQYQNWHVAFSSDPDNGGQGLGSPGAGWLNIVQDVAKLGTLDVVPDYDLTLQVPETLLNGLMAASTTATWLDPLSNNGLMMNMYTTGGRGDIGLVTQSNAAWLISGDARAAQFAMAQAETASAVPWHFYDAARDTWMNTDGYSRLWTDPRGLTGKPGFSGSTGLTQQIDWTTGWAVDVSHQPSLSFVPYVMTGQRWMLDNIQAQAAATVMGMWPTLRGNANDIVVNGNQVRGAAWAIRELEDAAWASPDGSAERAYFRSAADANWAWIKAQIPTWTAQQGEAHGYLPGVYGDGTAMAPWQQDFFAGIAITAASRGNADALAYLQWAKNFLVGRFEHAADGFNFHDGAAYNLAIVDPATGSTLTTWRAIGEATVARGMSNGTGWAEGYFGQLALSTLAGLYHLTGDEEALQVYKMLAAASPSFTGATDFARDASWAITIPGIYGRDGSSGGGGGGSPVGGDDVQVLSGPVSGRVYDLGAGSDKLVLADGGNDVEVRRIETVTGGAGDDKVRWTDVGGSMTIDLGAGNDTLVLTDGSRTTVVASNIERIIGGTNYDGVTLTTLIQGGFVDLGGSEDSLALASGGPNSLTVANVEALYGGDGDDDVVLATVPPGMTIDLRGGNDRLVLPVGTANTVEIRNVETVVGGNGIDSVTVGTDAAANLLALGVERVTGSWRADVVTLGTGVLDGMVDLRDSADRLVLSDDGSPNRLSVRNVETIIGGSGADDITVLGRAFDMTVDLGGGADRLALDPGYQNTLKAANVETIIGGAYADTVTLTVAARNSIIDLGDGIDWLILPSTGKNVAQIRNVEYVVGGTAFDQITLLASDAVLAKLAARDSGAAKSALDAMVPEPTKVSVGGIDRVRGSIGDEIVTFSTAAQDASAWLGGGADKVLLYLWGENSVDVRGTESIYGGGYADTVKLTGLMRVVDIVDLGYGADTLILDTTTASSLRVTVANTETIRGGADSSTVIVTTAAQNMVVDLGAGTDRIELAAVDNVVSLANVEFAIGNAGADRLTVTGGAGSYLDGAAGNDLLVGGSGADTLVGDTGRDTLNGGSGTDSFRFESAAASPASAPDVIAGFDPTDDSLVFSGMLSGSFAYRGKAAFSASGNTEARYVTGTQLLQIDLNGDGIADMALQLDGTPMANLTAADFVWI